MRCRRVSQVFDRCHPKCSQSVCFVDGNIFAWHEPLVGKPITSFVAICAFDVVVERPVASTVHKVADFIFRIRAEPDDATRITMEFPQVSIDVAFGI